MHPNSIHTPLRFVFSCAFILSFFMVGFAQSNIKVGYNGAYPQLSQVDELLTLYGAQNAEVESNFETPRFMHGIELGYRYTWSNLGIELGWTNLSNSSTAIHLDAATQETYDRELDFSFNSYGIGLQNLFGSVGYGANFSYNRLKIKSNIGTSSEKADVLKDNFYGSRFYLMWNAYGSGNVSLSLQPYFQVSWSEADLSDLSQSLLGNTNPPDGDLNESPVLFGLSLVFYNGAKPR